MQSAPLSIPVPEAPRWGLVPYSERSRFVRVPRSDAFKGGEIRALYTPVCSTTTFLNTPILSTSSSI
jgi:hypothetical protein